MAKIDWLWEAEMTRVRYQVEGWKDRYFREGLEALGMECPYPTSSFAGIHWRRGAAQRRAA